MLRDDDFTIVSRYQAEFQGIVQYYLLAQNVSHFGSLQWVMQQSLCRTLAAKHKSSAKTMTDRYRTTVQTEHGPRPCLQVAVERDSGKPPLVAQFGGIPLRRNRSATLVDRSPTRHRTERTELLERLLADTCELCGSTNRIEVHHVRHLRDLNRNGRQLRPRWMEVMAARREKDPSHLPRLPRPNPRREVRRPETLGMTIGEPGALKGARPVQKGAVGKGPPTSSVAPGRRPTLQTDYSVYTMRKASRRSWRIGQTCPVKVVFFAYRNTLQADALTLVARKLQSSLAVEGELPEDGLAAYGDDGADLLLAGGRARAGSRHSQRQRRGQQWP